MAGARILCRQDKKDLKRLADDFKLSGKEVQEIINTCQSYAEGQRAIMRAYDRKYMRK